MITVFLAEDHALVRHGIRAVFESEGDIRVVGETGDGLEVADGVDQLRPDVLLLDLGLPGLHGLEVTRQVAARTPSTRVLILSMNANEEYVIGALKHGAAGFVLKGSDIAELVTAVRRVAAGGRYVSPLLSEQLVTALVGQTGTSVPDPYDTLSDRERAVFQLIAEGHSNTAIGKKLFISTRTVETHRANALRKLGLRRQHDIVQYAIRRGILRSGG